MIKVYSFHCVSAASRTHLHVLDLLRAGTPLDAKAEAKAIDDYGPDPETLSALFAKKAPERTQQITETPRPCLSGRPQSGQKLAPLATAAS